MHQYILFAVVCLPFFGNSYVLVQVKKGDSLSNVDAIIHKKIPSDKVQDFTKKLKSQNFKRFEVRKRAEDEEAPKTIPESVVRGVDSLLFNVETGVHSSAYTAAPKLAPDAVDRIHNMIVQFAKSSHNPIYRASDEFNIKPEVVEFHPDAKSLKYDIKADNIIQLLLDFITSETVSQFADVAARKAAVVYKTIKEEMAKDDALSENTTP